MPEFLRRRYGGVPGWALALGAGAIALGWFAMRNKGQVAVADKTAYLVPVAKVVGPIPIGPGSLMPPDGVPSPTKGYYYLPGTPTLPPSSYPVQGYGGWGSQGQFTQPVTALQGWTAGWSPAGRGDGDTGGSGEGDPGGSGAGASTTRGASQRSTVIRPLVPYKRQP